jgi:hypothetical protein
VTDVHSLICTAKPMQFFEDILHLHATAHTILKTIQKLLLENAASYLIHIFLQYFRFSVGGMTDVSEIKGHR